MKIKLLILSILILNPTISIAEEPFGVLYGSIKLEEKTPRPDSVSIILQCGESEKKDWSLFTAISVDVPGTFESPYPLTKDREKCTLIFFISKGKESQKIKQKIYLYKKPRRYDFIITREGDQYAIIRR